MKDDVGYHRRTRIRASRCCKGRTKKNVVKNHVQIRFGIKPNTLRAGFKQLTPNPRIHVRKKLGGAREEASTSGDFLTPEKREITEGRSCRGGAGNLR